MKIKQLIYQLCNSPYIEIYLISGNKIIDILHEKDTGQRWLISQKTNNAFILPDRSEGLLYKNKVIFIYSNESATPLSLEDRININIPKTEYLYELNNSNKFIKIKNPLQKSVTTKTNLKTKKLTQSTLQPTTISPTILKSIINTKIIEDLLKSNESIWEALKIPLIMLIIAITIIIIIFTI